MIYPLFYTPRQGPLPHGQRGRMGVGIAGGGGWLACTQDGGAHDSSCGMCEVSEDGYFIFFSSEGRTLPCS